MTFMNLMTAIIFGFFYVVLAWCSGLFYQKNSWQAWSVRRLTTWQVSNDDLLLSSVSHIRRSWLSCQGVAMLAMCKKSRYCAKVTSPTANIGKDKSKWKHSITPICERYMVSFATMQWPLCGWNKLTRRKKDICQLMTWLFIITKVLFEGSLPMISIPLIRKD